MRKKRNMFTPVKVRNLKSSIKFGTVIGLMTLGIGVSVAFPVYFFSKDKKQDIVEMTDLNKFAFSVARKIGQDPSDLFELRIVGNYEEVAPNSKSNISIYKNKTRPETYVFEYNGNGSIAYAGRYEGFEAVEVQNLFENMSAIYSNEDDDHDFRDEFMDGIRPTSLSYEVAYYKSFILDPNNPVVADHEHITLMGSVSQLIKESILIRNAISENDSSIGDANINTLVKSTDPAHTAITDESRVTLNDVAVEMAVAEIAEYSNSTVDYDKAVKDFNDIRDINVVEIVGMHDASASALSSIYENEFSKVITYLTSDDVLQEHLSTAISFKELWIKLYIHSLGFDNSYYEGRVESWDPDADLKAELLSVAPITFGNDVASKKLINIIETQFVDYHATSNIPFKIPRISLLTSFDSSHNVVIDDLGTELTTIGTEIFRLVKDVYNPVVNDIFLISNEYESNSLGIEYNLEFSSSMSKDDDVNKDYNDDTRRVVNYALHTTSEEIELELQKDIASLGAYSEHRSLTPIWDEYDSEIIDTWRYIHFYESRDPDENKQGLSEYLRTTMEFFTRKYLVDEDRVVFRREKFIDSALLYDDLANDDPSTWQDSVYDTETKMNRYHERMAWLLIEQDITWANDYFDGWIELLNENNDNFEKQHKLMVDPGSTYSALLEFAYYNEFRDNLDRLFLINGYESLTEEEIFEYVHHVFNVRIDLTELMEDLISDADDGSINKNDSYRDAIKFVANKLLIEDNADPDEIDLVMDAIDVITVPTQPNDYLDPEHVKELLYYAVTMKDVNNASNIDGKTFASVFIDVLNTDIVKDRLWDVIPFNAWKTSAQWYEGPNVTISYDKIFETYEQIGASLSLASHSVSGMSAEDIPESMRDTYALVTRTRAQIIPGQDTQFGGLFAVEKNGGRILSLGMGNSNDVLISRASELPFTDPNTVISNAVYDEASNTIVMAARDVEAGRDGKKEHQIVIFDMNESDQDEIPFKTFTLKSSSSFDHMSEAIAQISIVGNGEILFMLESDKTEKTLIGNDSITGEPEYDYSKSIGRIYISELSIGDLQSSTSDTFTIDIIGTEFPESINGATFATLTNNDSSTNDMILSLFPDNIDNEFDNSYIVYRDSANETFLYQEESLEEKLGGYKFMAITDGFHEDDEYEILDSNGNLTGTQKVNYSYWLTEPDPDLGFKIFRADNDIFTEWLRRGFLPPDSVNPTHAFEFIFEEIYDLNEMSVLNFTHTGDNVWDNAGDGNDPEFQFMDFDASKHELTVSFKDRDVFIRLEHYIDFIKDTLVAS